MKHSPSHTGKKSPGELAGPHHEPADAEVIALLSDIRCARCRLGTEIERGPWPRASNSEDRGLMQWYERESWRYLMQYLTTAEIPDWIVEDEHKKLRSQA